MPASRWLGRSADLEGSCSGFRREALLIISANGLRDDRIAAPGNRRLAAGRAVQKLDIVGLLRALAPFRIASNARGTIELALTAAPLLALWIATTLLVRAGFGRGCS